MSSEDYNHKQAELLMAVAGELKNATDYLKEISSVIRQQQLTDVQWSSKVDAAHSAICRSIEDLNKLLLGKCPRSNDFVAPLSSAITKHQKSLIEYFDDKFDNVVDEVNAVESKYDNLVDKVDLIISKIHNVGMIWTGILVGMGLFYGVANFYKFIKPHL